MAAAAAAAPPARPPLPELVPVQLTLGSSRGTLQDWVLWPVAAADEELAEFSEGFVRDLGVPLQFRRPVAEAVRSQVADWCANVPPPVAGLDPRRELIKLDLVLGGAFRLRDQFWWDLHAAAPTPEEFAAELVADLGLEPTHGAAVAAAIRIELGKLRRAPPANLQLPTPRISESVASLPAADAAALRSVFSSSCLREPEQWEDWGPSLHALSAEEARALQQQQLLLQQRQQEQLAARVAARLQLQQAVQLQAAQAAQQAQQAVDGVPAAGAGAAQGAGQPSAGAASGVAQQSQGTAAPPKRPPPAPRAAEPEPTRRTLRPRRANRLAEILRKEEEEEADSSGSEVSGSAQNKSAAAGGASRTSAEYQPGEGSLQQDEAAEEVDARSLAKSRQRKRPAADSGAQSAKRPASGARHQPSPQAAAQRAAQRGTPATPLQPALPTPQQPASLPAQLGSSGNGLGMPGMLGVGAGGMMNRSMLVGLSNGGMAANALAGGGGMVGGGMQLGGLAGGGMVPVQPPAGMMPTPGQPEPLPALGGGGGGLPTGGVTPQHMQMVGAAIVHYARELGIGEHKIQSFLVRSPTEQVALFRNLHLLVQQARTKQALAGGGGAPPPMPPPMPAPALAPPPMPAPMAPMMPPPMPAPMMGSLGSSGLGSGGLGGGLGGGLPPMPMPMAQQAQQAPAPASQYANLFSEMFD